VFAEGAAMLVLEPLDQVLERGGRAYAEVLGSGHTNDAGSMVRPTGPGARECIEDALGDAGVDAADVVHVNAHGTGTTLNDELEAAALHEVFGTRPPPTTSIKRVLGHAAGASGAFEAAAAALTLHHGLLPSLGTDVQPDEALELDLVVGPPRPFEPGPILSNSFGLGGANGCLVLGPIT
jgi:3-oxoacyl-[acyl-carrier-protein] synthase II